MDLYHRHCFQLPPIAGEPIICRHFKAKELNEWWNAIDALYERMRARAAAGPYEIVCDDLLLKILPNVYAPRFFTDSLWFARQLPLIVGRASLLEIGSGTGIISIACARNGARVVAVDINPDAVTNTRLNAARHELQIDVIEGNLFDPLTAYEKFDYIFWAHPFNNWETPVLDMLMRSGRDYDYQGLKGYISDAKHYLAPHGRLLLGTGDSADLTTIMKAAKENDYRLRLLKKAQMSLAENSGPSITYLILELERIAINQADAPSTGLRTG